MKSILFSSHSRYEQKGKHFPCKPPFGFAITRVRLEEKVYNFNVKLHVEFIQSTAPGGTALSASQISSLNRWRLSGQVVRDQT